MNSVSMRHIYQCQSKDNVLLFDWDQCKTSFDFIRFSHLETCITAVYSGFCSL